jgi:hypothetical protein
LRLVTHALGGVLCILFVLSFVGCSKEKASEAKPLDKGTVVTSTTVLSTIAPDEIPQSGDPRSGQTTDPAVQTQPAFFHVVFNPLGRGVAHIAEKQGKSFVVYNGKAGRPYQRIGRVVLSPDGRRVAYEALVNDKWRMVVDGTEGDSFDEVDGPVFSPDSQNVAYRAKRREKWHIIVGEMMDSGSAGHLEAPQFSSDSRKVVYVEVPEGNRKGRLVVSDVALERRDIKEANVGDLLVNADKTRIAAVVAENGHQKVVEFSFAEPAAIKEGRVYDSVSYLAFGAEGGSLSYAADKGSDRFLVLDGREERLPEAALVAFPVIRPDQKGVGAIMAGSEKVFLHQAFYDDGIKERQYDEIDNLVYSQDGKLRAYAARKGKRWSIVVNGKDGPAFDRVVSPTFSPDGSFLVYRAREDGVRFVVVADANGTTISQHPAYEQVFQPVFTADGTSIAYGVKDGNKLVWKVEKLDN